MRSVGILDYGMGNINSVYNALNYLGYDCKVFNNPDEINSFSHLIIPGVGSYHQAMKNINNLGVYESILNFAKSGRPLLGICLGMQILSDTGDEGGRTSGLGLIPGQVEYIEHTDKTLPVPHVGWNSITYNFEHSICSDIKKHVDFYFVHSYFFNPESESYVLAYSDYGQKLPAVVVKDNVVGIQFHPEKSQDNGLRIIENFCEWEPC